MYFSTSTIITASLSLISTVPSVLAHGYVKAIQIDGVNYAGNRPQAKGDSVIRTISSSFPINDVNDLSTNCGIDAGPAALTADAKPGSTITFDWAGGDDGKWPHNTGPILEYIASCDGDCSQFDSQLANWVKISQVGRKGKGQPWVQQDLFEGKTFSMKLPEELPNGNYLLRHEVIGLHIAGQRKGVEMYPSCIQIKVSGGKDGSLPTDTVKFPGAYKQDEPGILINNQFDSNADYPFPGPKLATFGGSGGGAPTTTADGPSATVTKDGPTSTVRTNKYPDPSASASSSDAPTATTAAPALVTVTEYVTVTESETTPTQHSASTATTVTTFITVTAEVGAATTTAAYGGYSHDESSYRARRSRIFGKRSGH